MTPKKYETQPPYLYTILGSHPLLIKHDLSVTELTNHLFDVLDLFGPWLILASNYMCLSSSCMITGSKKMHTWHSIYCIVQYLLPTLDISPSATNWVKYHCGGVVLDISSCSMCPAMIYLSQSNPGVRLKLMVFSRWTRTLDVFNLSCTA